MKICAVVAEFNIFHNGHAYLLNKLRLEGFTHIITIMSGNFVQRGEAAIVSKEARVHAALENGSDIVIELPTVNVLSCAEKYAFCAMSLIKHLGCVDTIAFGSETGDLKKLNLIKNALKNPLFSTYLKEELSTGVTFYLAREKAVCKILGDYEILLEIKKPNNILGIEYLKAIETLNLNCTAFTVKRLSNCESYTSASCIREMILKGNPNYKKYIPASSCKYISAEIGGNKAPVDFFSNDNVVLSKLRSMSLKEFSQLPDISEGLENRIHSMVNKCCFLKDLLSEIKTKRYALSRIRRIIICAFLGINNKISNLKTPYIRVLGANSKGFEIMKIMKKTATLPVITRYSDVLNSGEDLKYFFELESKFTDLYTILTPQILPCGLEKSFKLIKD